MLNILIPTDFSTHAGYAADFAISIAAMHDAQLHFLHVVEYPAAIIDPMGMAMPSVPDLELIKAVGEKARHQMADLIEDLDVNALCTVESGSLITMVENYADENQIDLIIMGTKGASGLKEVFIGSNAEKVVKRSLCPVITMHEECEASEIEKIVFISDILHERSEIMRRLVQLSKILGSNLHIVYHHTDKRTPAENHLELIKSKAEQCGLVASQVTCYDKKYEREELMAFSRSLNADLIALGTESWDGVSNILTGSIAEGMINHARCPLWTYHLTKY